MKPYHNLKLISAYLFPSLYRRDREREKERRKRERDRETSVHCNTYNITPLMSHFLSHSRGDESINVRSREAADLI